MRSSLKITLDWAFLIFGFGGLTGNEAAELVVRLDNSADVLFVGAIDRWSEDGNPRRPVDPKAKMELPSVDAVAKATDTGIWTFTQLPPGRYDLVIVARNRIRIEGFGFPPILEFDPFIGHADKPPDAACEFIAKDIAKSRLYENKVTPLFFAGDDQAVRVFVQLLRDDPTSFDGESGEPVATLRHEVWQYTNRYGAWSKEKRTRVFDRILTGRRTLQLWTWVWEPAISQIELAEKPATVRYTLPKRFVQGEHRGLLP